LSLKEEVKLQRLLMVYLDDYLRERMERSHRDRNSLSANKQRRDRCFCLDLLVDESRDERC